LVRPVARHGFTAVRATINDMERGIMQSQSHQDGIIHLYENNIRIETLRYPNGQIMVEGRWLDEKLHGVVKLFYDDGSKKCEVVMHHGEMHGPWFEWHRNGKVATMGHYTHGQRTGTWIECDVNGHMISQIEWGHHA